MAERWWLVAGLLKTGSGSLEPGLWDGEPSVLRTDDARLTSLFGGSGEERARPKTGVVESAWENATDALEGERVVEAGRDGGWLESRDDAMLLDKRRSQDCGRTLGVLVLACRGLPSFHDFAVCSPLALPRLPLPLPLPLRVVKPGCSLRSGGGWKASLRRSCLRGKCFGCEVENDGCRSESSLGRCGSNCGRAKVATSVISCRRGGWAA